MEEIKIYGKSSPLVSIVIPVYNVEQYISRTVNSVLNQNYKDIEIILVNDGSGDCSLEICKALSEKDDRIIVVDKHNGGVASARNLGIDHAKGEYVTFVDSDDEVDPDYVSNLMRPVIETGSRFVQAGYVEVSNGKSEEIPCTEKDVCLRDMEQVLLKLRGLVCSKIFSMATIGEYDIRFPEDVTLAEDLCFVLSYVACVERWDFIRASNYHYIKRMESASHKRHPIQNLYTQLELEYNLVVNLRDKFNLSGRGLEYRKRCLSRNLFNFFSNLFQYSKKREIDRYLKTIPKGLTDLGAFMNQRNDGEKLIGKMILKRRWFLLFLTFRSYKLLKNIKK